MQPRLDNAAIDEENGGEYDEIHLNRFQNDMLSDIFPDIAQDVLLVGFPWLATNPRIPVWNDEMRVDIHNYEEPHSSAFALKQVYEVICFAKVQNEMSEDAMAPLVERWLIHIYQNEDDLYRSLFNKVFFAKMDWSDSFKRELSEYNLEPTGFYSEYLLYHEGWMLQNCPQFRCDGVLNDWREEFSTRFELIRNVYQANPDLLDTKSIEDIIVY